MFDAARFAWLQSLVDHVTRRQALAGVLGMAALALNEDTEAKKKKRKKKNKKKKKKDKGCPGKQVKCDGQCRDLSSDVEFCGECWYSCDDGQICDAGICTMPCSEHVCIRGEFGTNHSVMGIDLDAQGNLVTVLGDQIVILTTQGKVVRTIGEFGIEPGEFRDPNDVSVGPSGSIYVADYGNDRIQVVEPSGEADLIEFDGPQFVAVSSSGAIYASDRSNITHIVSPLIANYKWGPDGTPDTNFDYLTGMAVDELGDIYALDGYVGKIYRFADGGEGGVLVKWEVGGIGVDPREFRDAQGIAVFEGRVYIADTDNSRVQVLDAVDGAFLFSFPVTATDGISINPGVVAVDSNRMVYVADWWNIYSYFLKS